MLPFKSNETKNFLIISIEGWPNENLPTRDILKGSAMDLISSAEKITAGSPRTRDTGLIGISSAVDPETASTNDFWGRGTMLGLRIAVGLIMEA